MRAAMILAVLVLAACSSRGQEREAARATAQRSFEVSPFHAVSLEGSHDVVVQVGAAPSVRAEGDAETIERLDVRVEGGTLRIGTLRGTRGWFDFRQSDPVTVYVTAPAIDGATVAGSGDMRIDRIRADAFAAEVAGSGDLDIAALQAQRASFSLAGSGNIQAAGAAESAEVSIAGSGNIGLERLQTRRASITVAGSGDVSVRASEAVDGSLMGSGDVVVHGSARCSISRMGSGDIRCGA